MAGRGTERDNAIKDLVKSRMAVMAMEQLLAGAILGKDEGPLRFNRWERNDPSKGFYSVVDWSGNRSPCSGSDSGGPFFLNAGFYARSFNRKGLIVFFPRPW